MATQWKRTDKVPIIFLPHDPRVKNAIRLIHSEFKNHDLTVSRIAQKLRLSPSRLRQLFTAEIGSTPKSYIREVRLARARTLLEQSVLSVKEVMAAVGFNDPSHFSKDYKKRFGIIPSKYRGAFHTGEDNNISS